MSDNWFPDEILVEIFQRLAPKTLVICSAVCKAWRSVITDPSLISLHQRRSPSFLLHVEFFNDDFSVPNSVKYSFYHSSSSSSSTFPLPSSVVEFCNQPPIPPSPFSPKLPFLTPLPIPSFSVVALCNGLICIAYDLNCQYITICNPSIRRFVSLPVPRKHRHCDDSWLAFGYDSTHRDYKVLRISALVDNTGRCGLSAPQVQVYSLATGFWRSLPPASTAPVCVLCSIGPAFPHGLVNNGLVHWGAKRNVNDAWYYFVLSFNFEDELFGEILLPDSAAGPSVYSAHDVTVFGGGNGNTLAVYHQTFDSSAIWVMTEYGNFASWNKVFAFNLGHFSLEAPSLGIKIKVEAPPSALCVTDSGGEVLLLVHVAGRSTRTLYSLDLFRKTFTDLQIQVDAWCVYSGYYSETLVLLNKPSAAAGVMSY